MLLLQEFNLEVKDWKGIKNQVADHLFRFQSWSHMVADGTIQEEFPDKQILALSTIELPWYVDIVNQIMSGLYPPEGTNQQRKRLHHESLFYT